MGEEIRRAIVYSHSAREVLVRPATAAEGYEVDACLFRSLKIIGSITKHHYFRFGHV